MPLDADVAVARPSAWGRLAQWRLSADPKQITLIFLVALTGVLLVAPLLMLLRTSLTPGSQLPITSTEFTLANFANVFGQSNTLRILTNTLVYALTSVACGLVVAATLAWLIERTDLPLRDGVRTIIYCSMAVPTIALAFGWILLMNPGNGALNVLLRNLFNLPASPLNVYTLPAMVFITLMGIVPTMFTMLSGVFSRMDPQLEQAATVSGASSVRVLTRISLPVLLPGILSSVIYMLVVSIQLLDTPIVIGLTAQYPVLSTQIFLLGSSENREPSYGLSASFGVVLLLIAVLFLAVYFRATRVAERFRVITGKAFRPRRLKLGIWKMPAVLLVCLYLLAGVLPILILIWTSLFPFYRAPSVDALSNATLQNYVSLARQELIQRAMVNTVFMVLVVGTCTMLLSSLISWYAVRVKGKVTTWLNVIAFLPLGIPSIVFALAMLVLYVKTPLYGTVLLICIAQIAIFLAYGTRSMNAAVLQIHSELEHAAMASGISWAKTLRFVVLPLLWPQFLNGWLWVVAHSMRDLAIPLVLLTTQNVVLSSALYLLWQFPDVPRAAGLAVVMIVSMLLVVVPVQLFAMRRGDVQWMR